MKTYTWISIWAILGLIQPAWGLAEDAVVAYNNVVVVLDASGSMGDMMHTASVRKMDAAKQALSEVLKQVSPDTQVGIIVFSAKNLNDDWIYPLGPVDPIKLQKAIQLPEPGYKTPLGAFIKKGADRLLEQRAQQYGYGSYRLLIVTDGEASDPMLVDQYVPEVIARGIIIDVIGVDMQRSHTLATRVNSYRRADDPQSLMKAVADVFAEVTGTGDDTASDETFDEIAPIPFEMAEAMLKALAENGNHPIGTRPDTRQAGNATPPPSQAKTKSSAPSPDDGSRVVTFVAAGFFLVLALLLFMMLRKKR